jgi:hypothetical protein
MRNYNPMERRKLSSMMSWNKKDLQTRHAVAMETHFCFVFVCVAVVNI